MPRHTQVTQRGALCAQEAGRGRRAPLGRPMLTTRTDRMEEPLPLHPSKEHTVSPPLPPKTSDPTLGQPCEGLV